MQIRLAAFAFLLLVQTVLGQAFYSKKDLVFSQIGIGANVESLITLTNRGWYTYEGTLLFRKGDGSSWNPLVNGVRTEAGEFKVILEPDKTQTFRLSGDQLETGMAILIATDLIPDNFVEGHLTYFFRDGGRTVDSVGVPPSTEFYLASLPFERLESIALALGNPNPFETQDIPVTLSLLTENGREFSRIVLDLKPMAHTASFLSELFPAAPFEKGKIEISAGKPVVGTALSWIDGELSTLPLEPAPVLYGLRMIVSDGTVLSGEVTLWAEGYFVKGYLMITEIDGSPVDNPQLTLVNGQLENGMLDLSFFGWGEGFWGEEVSIYFQHPSFSFEQDVASGTWVITFLSDKATVGGTFELTRVSR